MSFTVEESAEEAIERLTTSAGAILILGITIFGLVQTAAAQDVARGVAERILSEIREPQFRQDLGPEQMEAVESIEGELESVLADLPLALGLSPTAAVLLWLVAFVLGLVVAVVAIDTFGNERDTLTAIETERIGWKTLNLFVGTILFGIFFLIGLLLFVIPGLVFAVVTVFFPAAIVLDDESVFAAFSSSISTARENFLGTVGLVTVISIVLIAIGIVGTIVSGILPATPAIIVEELFSAVGTAFLLAIIARAYVSHRPNNKV